MCRTVDELTRTELNELKQCYHSQLEAEGSDLADDIPTWQDVPDFLVKDHYRDYLFEEDSSDRVY